MARHSASSPPVLGRPRPPLRPAMFLMFAVACLLMAPARGMAQEADAGTPMASSDLSPEEVNAISHNLSGQFMSPYCPGKTLRDCTSSQAATLRDEIHGWVEQGRSREWIEQQLVDRFGESILAAPKFKGFNALVWLFPFIAILVGLGLIFSFLQRQQAMKLASSIPGASVSEDYKADPALESELERELSDRQS